MSIWSKKALVAAVFLAGTMPVQAQTATDQQGWVEWGMSIGSQAFDSMMSPVHEGWSIVRNFVYRAEAEAEAERAKFISKLQTDLTSFSRNVDRTGFNLQEVTVSPDFIPSIGLSLQVIEPVPDETEAILRKEFEESPTLGRGERAVLLALLDIDETAEDFKLLGYKFSDLDINVIAIFPEMTIHFTKDTQPGPNTSEIPGLTAKVVGKESLVSNIDPQVN